MSFVRTPLTGQRSNWTTAWQHSEIMHEVSDNVGIYHKSPSTRVSPGGVGPRYAKALSNSRSKSLASPVVARYGCEPSTGRMV